MKKVVSLVLASIMVLAFSATAFAGAKGENNCNVAAPNDVHCGGNGPHGLKP